MTQIHGQCDGRFEPVRYAFSDNFEQFPEVGAAVAIALGYSGFGGSIAFADMENRVGFGYTPNAQLTLAADMDTRSGRLVDAFYDSLSV